MKKILKYSLAAAALLLALSFFLPIFSYTSASGGSVDAEKYYLYSIGMFGESLISSQPLFMVYLLLPLVLGVSALFANFKNKNVISSCLLIMASLLLLFNLIPIAQVLKQAASASDYYYYSLGAGFYIMFILACVLFLAALAHIAVSVYTERNGGSDTGNAEDRIKKLISLKSDGVLTAEEFAILLNRVKPQ